MHEKILQHLTQTHLQVYVLLDGNVERSRKFFFGKREQASSLNMRLKIKLKLTFLKNNQMKINANAGSPFAV